MTTSRITDTATTTLLLLIEGALTATLFRTLTGVSILSIHQIHVLSASPAGMGPERQILLLLLCYLVCFLSTGHHTTFRLAKAHQVFNRAMHTWVRFVLLSLAIAFCLHLPMLKASFLLLFYLLMLIMIPAVRLGFFYFIRYLRRSGYNHIQVLLVGNGYALSQLYIALSKPSAGIDIKGYFDDYQDSNRPGNLPYLGRPYQIKDYLQQNHLPHEVICCLPANRDDEVSQILHTCDEHHIRFTALPLIYQSLANRADLQYVMPVLTLSAKPEPFSLVGNRLLKRSFDLFCAVLLLLTLFPILFLVMTIISKLRYRGPVLFCNRRTDSRGHSYQHYSFGLSKSSSTARRLGIDRWAELLNVLTGHMSIVGVTPRNVLDNSELSNQTRLDHQPKYGIFNWKEHLAPILQEECHDNWYQQNWSFTTDLFIILHKLTRHKSANNSDFLE